MPCRRSRFKEDRSLQKCKPCLDCGLINRLQKGNCSTTSNAVCGDCLPGSVSATPKNSRVLWKKEHLKSQLPTQKVSYCCCTFVGATQASMCFPSAFRYYRKTKLSGFQDMECIPCGDPPPPYEPHCKHSSLLLASITGASSQMLP